MKLYTLSGDFIKDSNSIPAYFTGIVDFLSNSGYMHRIGEALIEADSSIAYYTNGKLHNLKGPAIDYYLGAKFWFVDNKRVSEEQHKLLHDTMKLKGLI